MFATYSVPGTDIVFACVMCALLMAWAYVVGRTSQLHHIKAEVEGFKEDRKWLCNDLRMAEAECLAYRDSAIAQHEKHAVLMAQFLSVQKRELSKKHRLAMQKYRAKCDARLSTQFEFMRSANEAAKAVEMVEMSGHNMPDFSALLSK